MHVVFEAYRDNNGLVLVKERLITGSRIDDCKTLMGQVIEPVLIYSAPVRSSVPQSIAKILFKRKIIVRFKYFQKLRYSSEIFNNQINKGSLVFFLFFLRDFK